jgi:hypothetical protein
MSSGGEIEVWKCDSNYELFSLKNQENSGNDHE